MRHISPIKTIISRVLVALVAGTLFPATVAAFSFEPISRTFAPSGPGATQTFRVTNTEDRDIAVKISMLTRSIDQDGKESNSPASDQFVVFPSQIVLHAKAQQVIRVMWRGTPDVASEKSFRIVAEQLPVNFGETPPAGGNIAILFRYFGSVYVAPKGAAPDVGVEKAEPGTGPDGSPGVSITCKNRGTAHVILNQLSITVTADDGSGTPTSRTFRPDQLEGLNDQNMLADSTRRFFLPLGSDFPVQNLHVNLMYTPLH